MFSSLRVLPCPLLLFLCNVSHAWIHVYSLNSINSIRSGASTSSYRGGLEGFTGSSRSCTRIPHTDPETRRNTRTIGSSTTVTSTTAYGVDGGLRTGVQLSRKRVLINALGTLLSTVGGLMSTQPAEARAPTLEPALEFMLQFDDDSSWPRTAVSQSESTLYVKVAKEEGEEEFMGARVSLAGVKLPAMVQLFPANMLRGAKWEDIHADTLSIRVEVYANGEGPNSGQPFLAGTGSTKYIEGLGDIITTPLWLPAAISLDPVEK